MTQQQETEILRMIGDMKGEIGEIRGQLREVIHNLNNLSMKSDGIAQLVVTNRALMEDVQDIKDRLTLLEAKENQRVGAVSLGTLLMKMPILGWLATAGIAAWAFLSGKVGQ